MRSSSSAVASSTCSSSLCSAPQQVFSREQILVNVWHSAPEWQDVATVSEHVHRLRAKIEDDPASPRRIVTVRGVGYRFEA